MKRCNSRRNGHGHLPKVAVDEWAGEGYCKRPAGWGVEDMKEGRCRQHGGASAGGGAPAGNKNAVTTGEHESIYASTLTQEERAAWLGIATDAVARVDEQLRLCVIRIRRMMGRIARLRQETYTTTEIIQESGQRAEGPVDLTKERRQATLGQIQSIEDAITRVESRHARLVKLRADLTGDDEEGEELTELLARLDALAGGGGSYEAPEVG